MVEKCLHENSIFEEGLSEENLVELDIVEKGIVEKWQLLESLLTKMVALERYHYQYLGMNYCLDSAKQRVRFEYNFRNPQTVWISFSFYPQSRIKNIVQTGQNLTALSRNQSRYSDDYLDIQIVSPYKIENIHFNQWIKRFNSKIDLTNFRQFDGGFSTQARQLIKRIDWAFQNSGIENVLSGDSGIDVPCLNSKV